MDTRLGKSLEMVQDSRVGTRRSLLAGPRFTRPFYQAMYPVPSTRARYVSPGPRRPGRRPGWRQPRPSSQRSLLVLCMASRSNDTVSRSKAEIALVTCHCQVHLRSSSPSSCRYSNLSMSLREPTAARHRVLYSLCSGSQIERAGCLANRDWNESFGVRYGHTIPSTVLSESAEPEHTARK